MNWIEFAHIRPTIAPRWGQSDDVLVVYYPGPDSNLCIAIAFYQDDAGWLEQSTFRELPAPRYWMPLPKLPEKR